MRKIVLIDSISIVTVLGLTLATFPNRPALLDTPKRLRVIPGQITNNGDIIGISYGPEFESPIVPFCIHQGKFYKLDNLIEGTIKIDLPFAGFAPQLTPNGVIVAIGYTDTIDDRQRHLYILKPR